MPLPRCFFDISINGIPTGRIVFELFTDICPKTCQNFKCLCTGEKGEGKTTFKPLHYKGTIVHRVVKSFIIQGGDFENGDGSGGESVYGGLFKDENFKLKHDSPFLLSMANKGPNTNGSQYFITTRAAPHLDGIHVVFGRVVSGSEFVTEMENQKVDSKSRPYADIRVSNCGELVLLKRGKIVKNKSKKAKMSSSDSEAASSSSSSEEDVTSSSSSEEERKRRKKKRKRHSRKKTKASKKQKRKLKDKKRTKKKKKRVSSGSSESESSSGESDQEPAVTSTVTEADLPPEISDSNRKSWLYRYSKSPSPIDGKKKEKREQPPMPSRQETVSSSGRMLKGRGNMRYRTPPPRISRWKSPDRNYLSRDRRSPDRDQYHRRSPDRVQYHRRSPDRDQYRRRSLDRDQHQKSTDKDRNHKSPDRDRYHRLPGRSPGRDRYHRSPGRDRYHRSPGRDRYHRSPGRDRYHRSPGRDRYHRSPDRDRLRIKSRSPDRSQHRHRSLSPSQHKAEVTSPVQKNKTEEQSQNEPDTKHISDRDKREDEEDEEDRTPPLYEQEEYWSNEVRSHIEEILSEGKLRRGSDGGGVGSKWDRGVASGPSDEDNELESAYQRVEQTLAEQQFGISALIGNMNNK